MKALRWTLINGFIGLCAVRGLFYGAEWAHNILVFVLIGGTIMVTIGAFVPDIKERIQKGGRSFPANVSIIYDTILIGMLVATGHFAYAGIWVWQMMCEGAIFNEDITTKED